MLSDTLRLIAAELKLHQATGAYLEPEAISVLYRVIEGVAVEIALIEAATTDAPPRRLTQEHLQGGNIVLFPIGRRPVPGGLT